MATLEDVRRFIAQHSGDGRGRIYHLVEKEFGMSREDAERIVDDVQGGGGMVDGGDVAATVLPAAAMMGMASSQTATGSPGNSGPGVAAAALAVSETHSGDDTTGSDDNRVERAGWPVGEDRKDWRDPNNEES